MFKKIANVTHEFTAAVLRILLVFVILLVAIDSMSRVYYSYMPLSTWVDFRSVTVKMFNGEPTVFIERIPVGPQVAVFHRTLIIRYPDNTKGCTASIVTVLDNPSTEVIVAPLSRIISPTCPEFLGNKVIDGVLQVSYMFDFPFGVKRTATRYSNRFSLSYAGGSYRLGEALKAK